jgi:hypothetical protein
MIPLSIRRPLIAALITAAGSFALTCGAEAAESYGPSPLLPSVGESAPKLFVDPPLAGPLARGVAIISYRVENLRILAVVGEEAVDVSPRVGHLHITLDDQPWHWAEFSDTAPIVIADLQPGPHKLLVQLADPTHKVMESKTVEFVVPKQSHS